jgi:flagellum-specific ATP synthase
MVQTCYPWSRFPGSIEAMRSIQEYGRVLQVVGMVIEGSGPGCAIGDLCRIEDGQGNALPAEVVGFRDGKLLLMPLGNVRGIRPGCRVVSTGRAAHARVGTALTGRILDAMGEPIDHRGPLFPEADYPLYAVPPDPVSRERISKPIDVGIKAINALLTLGRGQRIAIFSGSGVGKSTLLGMMARHTTAQTNVIALIGERGREVREFIEKDLGPEGLKRSVVVVATSDQHPLLRMRGAYLATAIAEYFRDRDRDVLLMMDSLTRFAMAGREVGLAIGEPPTAKGYTPTVFAHLPKLLERAGTACGPGSITGIYSVLVEGDDMNDPIADAVRSIADGHIVLSRELAMQNHYPAIDVLASVSRVMGDIVEKDQIKSRNQLLRLMATYKRMEDLIQIGAYVSGTNPELDFAIQKLPAVNAFLCQAVAERALYPDCLKQLTALLN